MNYTRFIYLTETSTDRGKKRKKLEECQADDMAIQSQLHKLVRSNTPPPFGPPTGFSKTDKPFTRVTSHSSLAYN